jgi:hypothetical protein
LTTGIYISFFLVSTGFFRDPATIDDAVDEILTYMETMKNPNHPDENKKSVRQIKNTPKDLKHGQLTGKKPVS